VSETIWQEVECGGYGADLFLWDQLAAKAQSVLDVGCGNGRVSIYLARRGHLVTGLDASEELLAELQRRSEEAELKIPTVRGDARGFSTTRQFDLVIAPMQLVQLLGGVDGRAGFLGSVADALPAGGRLAVALMDLEGEPTDAAYEPPHADILEIDGAVYSSLPLAVRTIDRGREIVIERLRTTIAPGIEGIEEHNAINLRLVSPGQLEREAVKHGLSAAGRITIDPTQDHVGSTVVLFERD